jgi:putative DNA-invertase from lambdoid prophage Rac
MAVYGYVRVSTDRQADEGVSLGAQERTLRGYALMQGLAIDQVFVESGVSGSTPIVERPEGAKLLAALRPGDIVLTAKLDRMFRSALDALKVLDQLRDMKVGLHMLDLGGDVTGNGISKLVFTILSAVAEAERDRIRERIADVKRDQKRQGRYLGGKVPYGFTRGVSGALEPVPVEQAVITKARELRSAGEPLRRIQSNIEKECGRRISLDALARIVSETAQSAPVSTGGRCPDPAEHRRPLLGGGEQPRRL